MHIEQTYPINSDEPVFRGHFPENPILPGVLIIAHLTHALSVALGAPLHIIKIKRQKFLTPVIPNVALTISVSHCEVSGDNYHVNYVALIDTIPAAKGSLIYAKQRSEQ